MAKSGRATAAISGASGGRDTASLRIVTQRLSSTSVKQLPVVIPQVARSLLDCKALLSSSESHPKESPEGVLVHRFTTQVTALLNDKSRQSRWAAVVLIKAAVELGDHAMLSKSAAWVRGLLNTLTKPDPPSTKQMCVIVLTRIFDLTHVHAYQTLVRQITTPSLPPFITACLNQISGKGPGASTALCRAILESFCHLLPDHPAIFRSFVPRLQEVVAPLVASTVNPKLGSQRCADPAVVDAARSLYSMLHFCAPKSGASVEYSKTVAALLDEIHSVAGQVFRAVHEDWQSFASIETIKVSSDGQPSQTTSNLLLPEWAGIYAGCERLRDLIALLQKFLEIKTVQPVAIPLGPMLDFCARMCMITVPLIKASNDEMPGMRANELISKDEREALWSQLPSIHVATIEFIEALCVRLGGAGKSLHRTIVNHVTWVFKHEKYSESIKNASYSLIATILEISAAGLSQKEILQLGLLFRACCDDLLPVNATKMPESLESSLEATLTDQKQNDRASGRAQARIRRTDFDSAINLLTTIFAKIPPEFLSRSLRAKMDRTAILINDPRAMLASTLNPPVQISLEKPYSSLIPFLARSKPESIEIEGLIRPRLPQALLPPPDTADLEDEASIEEDMEELSDAMDFQIAPSGSNAYSLPFGEQLDTPDQMVETTLAATGYREMTAGDTPQAQINSDNIRKIVAEDAISPAESQEPVESSAGRKRLTPAKDTEQIETKKPRIGGDGNPPAAKTQPAVPELADEDDSDDFVMPELTLEADTEDEEDG